MFQVEATRIITNIQKEKMESKWGPLLLQEINKHREAVVVANRRYNMLANKRKTSYTMKLYLKQMQVEAHMNLHVFMVESRKWIKIWGIDIEQQIRDIEEAARLRREAARIEAMRLTKLALRNERDAKAAVWLEKDIVRIAVEEDKLKHRHHASTPKEEEPKGTKMEE